ncbi:MAG: hypothetical protein IIC73_07270 [Armatimonadetes bacterium]|nr:hypothetical protein [Armatimonadota bacterium]
MNRAVAGIVLVSLTAAAWAQRPFVPPPIEAFDGKQWAGMVLGRTTDAEIKRMYQTQRGAVYPEALAFRPLQTAPYVDALLDGRGAKARVQGFLIRYGNGGPTPEAIAEALDEQPSLWYHPGRTEPWHAAVFWKRGVVLIVDEDQPDGRARGILLCLPEAVQNAMIDMTTVVTPYENRPDPGRNWNRSVNVWGLDLSLDLAPGVDEGEFEGLEKEVEDVAVSLGTGPRVVYIRGGRSRYTVEVSAVYDLEKDEMVWTGWASMSAGTPYGQVSAEAMAEQRSTTAVRSDALAVARVAINELNKRLGQKLLALKLDVIEVETLDAIERMLRLATVPLPDRGGS